MKPISLLVASLLALSATIPAGATQSSESAVARALKWLADHQMPDGRWSFDHQKAPGCKGRCGDHGRAADAPLAATGGSLLPFLGAGHTTKSGRHKDTVSRGLRFLIDPLKDRPEPGKTADHVGPVSGQSLATLALCEAYGMTHDRGLYQPAQTALDQLIARQDPKTGGWSTAPGQPPSTTATAWALAALKSGHSAYLRIPAVTVKKASDFLDAVQSDGGAFYGETKPGKEPRATAAGLLCRMYLGWKWDNPALVRGVKHLGQLGRSTTDLLFDRCASEPLRSYGGDVWTAWHPKMRDALVASQAREGHEAGSWAPGEGPEGKEGGRLWQTASSAAILVVDHRPHLMPPAVEDDFPK